MKAQWNGLWICAGDFNEALHGDEHMGFKNRNENQMDLFRDCIDECGLLDIRYIGPKFAWSNRQHGGMNIRVRLDRALANSEFLKRFDNCFVENIITTSSDHLAILITIAKSGDQTATSPVHNSFRFEAAWMRTPDYNQMIEENWKNLKDGAPSLNNTWSTLNKLSKAMQTWCKTSFGQIRKEIRRLEKRLADLRRNSLVTDSCVEEKQIEKCLCELFERE